MEPQRINTTLILETDDAISSLLVQSVEVEDCFSLSRVRRLFLCGDDIYINRISRRARARLGCGLGYIYTRAHAQDIGETQTPTHLVHTRGLPLVTFDPHGVLLLCIRVSLGSPSRARRGLRESGRDVLQK